MFGSMSMFEFGFEYELSFTSAYIIQISIYPSLTLFLPSCLPACLHPTVCAAPDNDDNNNDDDDDESQWPTSHSPDPDPDLN
jgi:hypothetical protein